MSGLLARIAVINSPVSTHSHHDNNIDETIVHALRVIGVEKMDEINDLGWIDCQESIGHDWPVA